MISKNMMIKQSSHIRSMNIDPDFYSSDDSGTQQKLPSSSCPINSLNLIKFKTMNFSSAAISWRWGLLFLVLISHTTPASSQEDRDIIPIRNCTIIPFTPKCPPALQRLLTPSSSGRFNCDRFKCVHDIKDEADCPPDTLYVKELSHCGCCGGCAKYVPLLAKTPRQEKDEGDVNSTAIVVNLPQCSPGLECNSTTGFCLRPSTTLDPSSKECEYKKTLYRSGLYHWDPICLIDGSYAPKQCKGDHVTGICFCVDKGGKRIFGQEFRVDAKNMTCECSRRVNDLRAQGLKATLHCTSNGNYEALQCDSDSGVCYCVEEKAGRMVGTVLPEKEWENLYCMSPNVTNFLKDGQYLRKCESQLVAIQTLVKEGLAHGMRVELSNVNCDYDGSYGARQVAGTRAQCVYKNGTRIEDYFAPTTRNMDCTCARDEFLYLLEGKPFSFICETQVGNYPNSYDYGAFSSCVDRDGMPYGGFVPSRFRCCLEDTCHYPKRDECRTKRYVACCDWPYGGTCARG